MPTIQVRIDDQTKAASTALFEQLGISMSDAVNMFLRQTIMRGGIPFTLTVPEKNEPGLKIIDSEAFVDALRRYKTVFNKANFDLLKAQPFLNAIESLDLRKNLRISLQENAVKIRFNFKNRDFVLDYNFEEPDNVFILSRIDGKLIVKDCSLAKISETLRLF